ncbi:uncharacterized protein TNCV_3169891 [Trichonephila clavipes]|nr:uncharacterized protein TNCV_3169891 [Trichonephila clavipes]
MLCDAREFADEIDIPANFDLTQPRHTVRRRNVNFDYEVQEEPIEDPTLKYKAEFYFFTLDKAINALESSLQLVKMLQVSRKSVGFHHCALGYIIVLMHLIVQVVRQGAVIQIPEMGQHFQVDCKKSQLFKNFPLVRSLDDDEISVSSGQVEPFIDVPVGPAVFGGREEVRLDLYPSSGMFDNRQFNGDRLATMVKHVGVSEKRLGIWQIGKMVQSETCKELGKASLDSGSVSRGSRKFFVPLTTMRLNLPLTQKGRYSTGNGACTETFMFVEGEPGVIHRDHLGIAGNGEFDGLALVA